MSCKDSSVTLVRNTTGNLEVASTARTAKARVDAIGIALCLRAALRAGQGETAATEDVITVAG